MTEINPTKPGKDAFAHQIEATRAHVSRAKAEDYGTVELQQTLDQMDAATEYLRKQAQEIRDSMSAPTREEIDARFETATAKMDGRLETIEARMDGRIASIEQIIKTNFAEFRADLNESTATTVKWISGIVATAFAVGISAVAFIFNSAANRPIPPAQPSQPIIIYAQPAPVAAPQAPPPPVKTTP